MIKKLLSAVAWVVLMATAFLYVNWLLRPMPADNLWHNINEEAEGSVDLLFAGTSHIYCGINPAIVWQGYGVSSANYTSPGQTMSMTYYYICEALKKQCPKVVVVDVLGAIAIDDYLINGYGSNSGRVFAATDSMDISINQISMLEDSLEWEQSPLTYLFGTSTFHTRWKGLSQTNVFSERDNTTAFAYKGYATSSWQRISAVLPPETLYPVTQDIGELDAASEYWLQKIIELSQEENFELLLVKIPTYKGYSDIAWQMRLNRVGEIAEEQQIPFYDLHSNWEDMGFTFETEFLNSDHLNIWGAEKTTRYLMDILIEKYPLEDHRGDDRYASWDTDLADFNRQIKIEEMIRTNEFQAYRDAYTTVEDLLILVSAKSALGPYAGQTGFLALQDIGEEMLAEGSFIGVWDEGDPLYCQADTVMQKQILGGYDMLPQVSIISGGEYYGNYSSIVVDGEEFSMDQPGLNVVIYDKRSEKVIDNFNLDTINDSGLTCNR